jgi:hypothetical protein
MKHLLIKTLAGSGLFLMSLTASAQYQPQYPPPPDPRYQVQDQREVQAQGRLFDRIRGDLDRARAGTIPFTADRNRVSMAQDMVNDCQRALANGEYDRRQFDDTVASIQRVADMDRLTDTTRSYLLDDARQLRDLEYRLGD